MPSYTPTLDKLHESGLFIQDSAFIDGEWVVSEKTFDVYGASFPPLSHFASYLPRLN
jgi:hypothetical protein